MTDTSQAEVKLSFDDYLGKVPVDPKALEPLKKAVADHNGLVANVNDWISQINAQKAQDPSNVEYLDKLWEQKYESDPEMVEVEAEFQAATEAREKALKKLRDFAKKNIPEQLSEEAAKQKKAQVNSAQPTIAEARKSIAAQLGLLESMLTLAGVKIPEGGLVTLLPQADSLKNARGRKASTGERKPYATRIGDVLIDGKSTRTEKGAKFDYAADALSQKFGASVDESNAVTAIEIEEAWFKAMGAEMRSKTSTEVDDEVTFDFTKTVKKQNPNDDGKTEVPVTVKLTVISVKGYEKANAPAESKSAANGKPAKSEGDANSAKPVTPEPMKIDTRTTAQRAADEKAEKAATPTKK